MKLSFNLLLILWLTRLVYDLVITIAGPVFGRSLADRMAEDSSIAWFIFAAWGVVYISRYFYSRDL